jgi:hypothetical protein
MSSLQSDRWYRQKEKTPRKIAFAVDRIKLHDDGTLALACWASGASFFTSTSLLIIPIPTTDYLYFYHI